MKRYFSLILAIAATVSAQIVPSTGNVRGPTSATDNAVARYDGTTGKLIQNSGVTIDDSGNLTVSGGGATFGASGGGDAVLSLKRASDGITVGNLTVNTSSSLLNLGTAYTFLTFSTEGTEKARFSASTGNLLLKSDGIDSSNGKLQLATHTTSAGGIGFGTGLSLFTSSTAGQLVLKDGSGTSPFLAFYDTSNNNRMAVGAIGTTSYVNSVAGPLQLWSSNTLALTLDSSQNATFAGTKTTFNSAAASTAGQRQNITSSVTAAASTVAKKVAYIGPTHSLAIRVIAVQDESTQNSAVWAGNFTTAYGGTASAGTTSAVVGNITGISVAYDNGGSPNYTLNVTLTYTGNAPVIYYTIDGHSFNAMNGL